MRISKKFLCLILSIVILISNITMLGSVFAQTADAEPLKIEVTTDKTSYTAYGIAEITVNITNTSDETVNNIKAEAVFEQLAPINSKTSETYKEIETLESGENFTFSYKATLNETKVNINFFEKIILWFVRLFNGGYNAISHNIETITEDITQIKFGKYTVKNVVRVGYDKKSEEITDTAFKTFQDIRQSIENLLTKEEVVAELENEKQKGNIKNYQIDENYITYETIFGIRGIWEDDTLFNAENKTVSLDEKSNKVKRTPSGNSYKDILKQVSSSSMISSLGDIAVIRPYRSTDFKYDDFITTGEIIADTIGVEIEIFDNANATLSVLKNLDDYGIVLVDSHGTLILDEPYICLTQIFDNQQVFSSDLGYIFINQHNQIRVHSSFFENNYSDNAFDDCLVFLGTCYSMYDSSFSNVLIEKGIDCVYGYTNPVSVTYCNNTLVESMLENILLDGDNSSVAFNETVSACGKTDPYNSETDFVMQCSKDFYLTCGELSGLVVTSVGTSNKPLANVTVIAENDDYKITGQTNTDGKFTLKLPLGTYEISLYLDDYISAGTSTITVDENTSNLAPYLFYMECEFCQYRGVVYYDDFFVGIPNVEMKIESLESPNYYSTITNESGTFYVDMPSGSYKVTCTHEDYDTFEKIVNLPAEFDEIKLSKKEQGTEENENNNNEDDTNKYGTLTDSGTCGTTAFWSFYEKTGVLFIGGTGYMANYTSNLLVPWRSYSPSIKTIIIDTGITSIDVMAFYDCYNLISINVNQGNNVFSNDDYGVLFNKDKTHLIKYPSGNPRTEYSIPNTVTIIGYEAFMRSDNLTKVTIPNSVKNINHTAFSECDSLTNITIPNGVTGIYYSTFYGCDNLTNIEMPDSITKIGDSAFRFCYNLTNVTIPNGVTNIGDYAFNGCNNLTSITISDDITIIGNGAFICCDNLTDVYYTGTEEQWKAITIKENNDCLINATIHYNS